MKINLVMIVKNEERSLRKCLQAAAGLVDQMIVVDTGSSDRTKSIAEDMGARIFDFDWVMIFLLPGTLPWSSQTGIGIWCWTGMSI